MADLETSPSLGVLPAGPKSAAPSASLEGAEEPVQHPQRWFIFGIVATAMMMGSLDQTVVATALPTLHKVLHSPINWVGWTVTTYQLGQVIAMPVAGRISDQFGRKRVFVTCVALFAVSSLMCGLADNIQMLIVFRGIQALGAGAFMPSATGIVADHFGRDRDRGIGLFTGIVPIGSLLGPVVGGVIIYYWEWRGVFLINLPIAAVVFVLAIVVIPKSKPKEVVRADLLGIAMLVATILPLMFAITMLGNGNTTLLSPVVLVPGLVAIGVGYVFIRRSLRIEAPIIPLPLLRTRAFATMNFISFMYGGCVLGFGALVPLYAEDRYHFASIQAGTLLTARGVGALCLAATSTYLLRRTGYRLPMVVGFSLAAFGMLMLGFGAHDVTPYVWLAFAAAIPLPSPMIAAPATNNATLSFAPGEVASIAGLRGMFRQIGAIVAISVTTAIVARSHHPGIQLGHSFMAFAVIVFFVVIPLVFTVPNRRGTW